MTPRKIIYTIAIISLLLIGAKRRPTNLERFALDVRRCVDNDPNGVFNVKVSRSKLPQFYERRVGMMYGCMKDIDAAVDSGARADALCEALVELSGHGLEMYTKAKGIK